jgi:FAD/FMN-containing dehydrogenase
MLATSACDQERPTLVLFAHIALQVQIMLRICFNRGIPTYVFGFGRFGPL